MGDRISLRLHHFYCWLTLYLNAKTALFHFSNWSLVNWSLVIGILVIGVYSLNNLENNLENLFSKLFI